jgi:hypothetical protein
MQKSRKFNGVTFRFFGTYPTKLKADLDCAVAKRRGKKARIAKRIETSKGAAYKYSRIVYDLWVKD